MRSLVASKQQVLTFISMYYNEIRQTIEVFRNSFPQANVANFPNLSNLSGHMNEIIHLIGGLLDQVYKYGPFKCVKMLNIHVN